MKVSELIAFLSKQNPESTVGINCQRYYINHKLPDQFVDLELVGNEKPEIVFRISLDTTSTRLSFKE